MGKKSWFSLLKRFFNITERHSRATKEKRRGWGSGRHKIKSSDPVSASAVSEAAEEQNRKTLVIKVGSDASNQCEKEIRDDEVVGLANTLHSTQQCEEETREIAALQIQAIAATKIQTAFRGYLARKALQALKGIVRLQAIIRGHAVRRQAVTTLKRLQSVVSIQSQVCARRIQIAEGTQSLQDFKDKLDSNSQRRWDDNLRLKDESNALFSKKTETFMKRERIKEYLTSHRWSAESEPSRVNSRWRYWLEQWVDTQLSKNPDTDFPPNAKIRSCVKKYQTERLDSSPLPVQRRSFHHGRQRSVGDDNGFASTPVVPTYMAATESAKARVRSMSSPRREINLDAYYSESNTPYKHKLSPRCSINSEVTSSSSSRIYNLSGLQQRSPRLKGHPGRLKLNRSSNNLSFDSECSLPNWDRNGALR